LRRTVARRSPPHARARASHAPLRAHAVRSFVALSHGVRHRTQGRVLRMLRCVLTPRTVPALDTLGGYGTVRAMAATARAHLDLPVEGMTCAGCVTRIERHLNELDGVDATVNLALERAAVDYDATRVSPGELVAAVAAAGYTARLPEDDAAPDDRLGLRALVAALFAVPVIVYAMAGGLQ